MPPPGSRFSVRPCRVSIVISATIAGFALAFILWHPLFALLYTAVATFGVVLDLSAHAISIARKKSNELGPTFTILALTGLILFTGWWVPRRAA